jgi:hypothetical protein
MPRTFADWENDLNNCKNFDRVQESSNELAHEKLCNSKHNLAD